MTGPRSSPPPASGRWPRRRIWLASLVGAWIVVVAGLGVWSVRHEPATVPEQRNISQAVPELQKAAGVTLAAAGGPGRAVVLEDLRYAEDCDVTPVRTGVIATRDVTLQVAEGGARAALDAVAAALPERYQALVAGGRGGTRFSLHADAGNFIGIDSSADAGTRVLRLRLSTGCRPLGDETTDPDGPAAGAVPGALTAVLGVLGEPPGSDPEVQTVACPDGPVAGTWTVDGVVAAADFKQRLARWAAGAGAETVRDDDSARAYRAGGDSVVVTPDAKRLRVSVTTGC